MASCSPTDLLAAASCWQCLPSGQLQAVIASLLCNIWKASNPVAACDIKSLLADASCFACLPSAQLQLIIVQLLCEILHSGGTGSGQGCLMCFDGSSFAEPGYLPPLTPTCDCAIAYDYGHGAPDQGSFWYWDPVAKTWIPFIGGG